MYKIQIDSMEKALKVTVSNNLNKNDSIEFLNELEKNIKEIDLNQHTLVFEIKDFETTSPGALSFKERIIKLIELYKVMI